jgi:hypothetical protein
MKEIRKQKKRKEKRRKKIEKGLGGNLSAQKLKQPAAQKENSEPVST